MANKISQLYHGAAGKFHKARGEAHYALAQRQAKKAGKAKDQASYSKAIGRMVKHDVKHSDSHLKGGY